MRKKKIIAGFEGLLIILSIFAFAYIVSQTDEIFIQNKKVLKDYKKLGIKDFVEKYVRRIQR